MSPKADPPPADAQPSPTPAQRRTQEILAQARAERGLPAVPDAVPPSDVVQAVPTVDAHARAWPLYLGKPASRFWLNFKTLPQGLLRLGANVFEGNRLRAEFPELHEQIDQAASSPPHTGWLRLWMRAAVARGVIRHELAELGRAALEKHGDEAGPPERIDPIRAGQRRRAECDVQIASIPLPVRGLMAAACDTLGGAALGLLLGCFVGILISLLKLDPDRLADRVNFWAMVGLVLGCLPGIVSGIAWFRRLLWSPQLDNAFTGVVIAAIPFGLVALIRNDNLGDWTPDVARSYGIAIALGALLLILIGLIEGRFRLSRDGDPTIPIAAGAIVGAGLYAVVFGLWIEFPGVGLASAVIGAIAGSTGFYVCRQANRSLSPSDVAPGDTATSRAARCLLNARLLALDVVESADVPRFVLLVMVVVALAAGASLRSLSESGVLAIISTVSGSVLLCAALAGGGVLFARWRCVRGRKQRERQARQARIDAERQARQEQAERERQARAASWRASLDEQQTYDLLELYRNDAVLPRGTGQSITHMTAEFENLTARSLRVRVAIGTYFVASGSHQNMVCREAFWFQLGPRETSQYRIRAACINAGRPIPTGEHSFHGAAQVSDRLTRFLVASEREDPMVVQAGVWAITDGYSRSRIQERLRIQSTGGAAVSDSEIARARTILDQLEIPNHL